MKSKAVSPGAVVALKQALVDIYWYKADLRSFLGTAIDHPTLLAAVDWNGYKRTIVHQVVDFLVRSQNAGQSDLLRLMVEVARVDDFRHLERLEDGPQNAEAALRSVAALRKFTAGHQHAVDEMRNADERRDSAQERVGRATALREKLSQMCREYTEMLTTGDAQRRGYRLEAMIRELFAMFDLDPKAAFRIAGEQIDGAFTFQGTDYLFECKWQQQPVAAKELDSLGGKLTRKLDNTLGLFLSVNGYSEEAVETHSSGRRLMLLMDGSDLMAVLEGRIDLTQLLLRKRRHAAQTGNIYLRISEVL
jgi:hypothetical protein